MECGIGCLGAREKMGVVNGKTLGAAPELEAALPAPSKLGRETVGESVQSVQKTSLMEVEEEWDTILQQIDLEFEKEWDEILEEADTEHELNLAMGRLKLSLEKDKDGDCPMEDQGSQDVCPWEGWEEFEMETEPEVQQEEIEMEQEESGDGLEENTPPEQMDARSVEFGLPGMIEKMSISLEKKVPTETTTKTNTSIN